MRLPFLIVILLLSACQSRPGSGGFYVYTDAQGNLITVESEPKEEPQREEQPVAESRQDPAAAAPVSDASVPPQSEKPQTQTDRPEEVAADAEEVPLDNYTPSEEVDAELEEKERDRFVSYVDETGRLRSRPLDLVAEREAREAEPEGYQPVAKMPFLETVRSIRADCCQEVAEHAPLIEVDSEVLVSLDERIAVSPDAQPYAATVYKVASDVGRLDLRAYIRKNGYLAAQLLWLDAQARPLLLVDQPFARRYPETWLRHGYLQGTLLREKGQRYLVVFLPYQAAGEATDGLRKVLDGELVIRGYQGPQR